MAQLIGSLPASPALQIQVLVHVLATLLPIQLLVNMLGRIAEDGPSAWR